MTLREKTQAYWELCSAIRGKVGTPPTVEQAINVTREILLNTGPQRKLAHYAVVLQNAVVIGNCKNEEDEGELVS